MLHYQKCTLLKLLYTCGCKKNALEDASAASLALHAQNFVSAIEKSAVPKFSNRLINTNRNWHCKIDIQIDIRYANVKVLSEPNFPVYWQNTRTYTRKYVSEKTSIFAYFTQCDVLYLLSQKFTHFRTRIIDIILKITNCKEIFS